MKNEKSVLVSNTLQWFTDRIGTRVYRENNGCDCSTCKNYAKNGVVVSDHRHAVTLLGLTKELGLQYFTEPQ